MKYHLQLCKACIVDLQDDWRILIPKRFVDIQEVNVTQCFHSHLDKYDELVKQHNPGWEEFWKKQVHDNPEIILEILHDFNQNIDRIMYHNRDNHSL